MDTRYDIEAGPAGQDVLADYLSALDRADAYVPVRSLSGSSATGGAADPSGAAGATELVRFAGAGGASLGPFVRKRIPLETGLGAAYEALFDAQRAGARFLHLPRIVECYKTGSELVVVSEYVPGEALDAYVARRRSEAAGDDVPHPAQAGTGIAAEVFPALCDAVTELHEACDPPLIHRDLKPGNVIVASAGLFLIDFGIARRYRDRAESDTVRFGTRRYAPPEQYGFGQTSVRSDVYALGMLLAFCLLGEEPDGPLDADTLALVAGQALAQVVLRATAFDPAARFESARALKAAFLAALPAGEGAAADSASAAGEPPVVSASVVQTGQRGSAGAAPSTAMPGDRAGQSAAAPSALPGTGRPVQAPSASVPAASSAAAPLASTIDASPIPMPSDLPSKASSVPQAEVSPSAPVARARRSRFDPKRPLPVWAAVLWDLVLGIFAVAFIQTAFKMTAYPTEENAGRPLWYLIVLNFILILPGCLGALYMAADKRWLKRYVPALARRQLRDDLRVYGLYLLVAFVALLVAASVAGV